MKIVSVRVVLYLAIFLIFVFFIEAKKAQVAKEKSQEVESILSLMMENGAPVTTYKVEPKDFIERQKVTLRSCDGSICFYISRDKKQQLNLGATLYEMNSNKKVGKINYISQSPDYKTGLYKVTVNGLDIQAEQNVYDVEVKTYKDSLVVPTQALEDDRYLWVVESNEKAKKVEVKTGDKNYQYVQIKEGIKAGQIIVLDGAGQIPIYKKIKIINEVDSSEKKVAPHADNSEAKS